MYPLSDEAESAHANGTPRLREEGALAAAVELARHLAGARLAWLTLPSDDSNQPQLVAASEHVGDERAGRPEAAVARDEHVQLAVPLPLEGGASGVLSVAGPFAAEGFGEEAAARLGAFATFVATHLVHEATRARVDRLQQQVHQLHQRVIHAQEEERRRIARDLHDEIGHTLSIGVLRLDLAALAIPAETPALRGALEHTRASLVECAEAIHRIVFALSPPSLDDLGLPAALQSLVAGASEAGIQAEVVVEGAEFQLPGPLNTAIFRIVQEALTNIRKHARATVVTVRLTYGALWLKLRIEDDGLGIAPGDARARRGLGLEGIRERAKAFGGSLTVGRRDGGGTVLSVQLPLDTVQPSGTAQGGEDG